MHNTNVKMKNGKTYSAPICEWRPQDGYFTIINYDQSEIDGSNPPLRIELADVAEAVTPNKRVHAFGPLINEDQLARARRDGWTP